MRPLWSGRGKLAPESRAVLRTINLTFHDLRRQFACTLLESGADHHDVRDFLGHANITTTSRYVQSTPLQLERVLAQMGGRHRRIRTRFAHSDGGDRPD